MALEARCDRCQGYFRNFVQVVRRGDATYCVQCDAAIKAGAQVEMYDSRLPASCLFDHQSLPGMPAEASAG